MNKQFKGCTRSRSRLKQRRPRAHLDQIRSCQARGHTDLTHLADIYLTAAQLINDDEPLRTVVPACCLNEPTPPWSAIGVDLRASIHHDSAQQLLRTAQRCRESFACLFKKFGGLVGNPDTCSRSAQRPSHNIDNVSHS
nr:hypothetical protein ISGA_5089 [Gordonia sp. NB41Y]